MYNEYVSLDTFKKWIKEQPETVIDVYPSLMVDDRQIIIKFFQELPNTGIGVKNYSLYQIGKGIEILEKNKNLINEAVIATITTPKLKRN